MLNLTAASLQPEIWTISSNDALQIFVTDSEGKAMTFQANFTYPIFGDSEQIFGYKDLVIYLCFDHYTFYPFLNVKYSEKLNDPSLEDPKQKMMALLPEDTVFKDELQWRDSISKEQQTYEIPGQQFGDEFEMGGDTYAVYQVDLKRDLGLELHKRLQILVLLFIEAGSYIDSGDSLWDLYVLYKTTKGKDPSIVGFCTAYNYWKYGGHEKFDNGVQEVRKKISQFVILPMYQGKRLGGAFYNQLYAQWLEDERVIQVVVEDPNESFDDLRDRSDLSRLCATTNIASVSLPLDNTWAHKLETQQKLEKRQFSRLLEMILLYQLKNKVTGVSERDVRLFIKRRLYEKNKEVLEGFDKPTRLDKLQTAYQSLEQDYLRILDGMSLYKRGAASETPGVQKKQKT